MTQQAPQFVVTMMDGKRASLSVATKDANARVLEAMDEFERNHLPKLFDGRAVPTGAVRTLLGVPFVVREFRTELPYPQECYMREDWANILRGTAIDAEDQKLRPEDCRNPDEGCDDEPEVMDCVEDLTDRVEGVEERLAAHARAGLSTVDALLLLKDGIDALTERLDECDASIDALCEVIEQQQDTIDNLIAADAAMRSRIDALAERVMGVTQKPVATMKVDDAGVQVVKPRTGSPYRSETVGPIPFPHPRLCDVESAMPPTGSTHPSFAD